MENLIGLTLESKQDCLWIFKKIVYYLFIFFSVCLFV